MAGHSKWANIQHRKGRQDKLRSKLFSKLAKDIATASKIGGPDPDMNPRLRLAIAMSVRTAFSKNGGNMGETGSVSFMFDQAGKIEYPLETTDEDTMMEAAIEAGADDCETDEAAADQWDEFEPVHTIWTARDDLGEVSAALNEKFGDAKSVNLVWKAQNNIDNPSAAAQIVRLQDALEDLDDVENVYHNFEMSEEAAATLESE